MEEPKILEKSLIPKPIAVKVERRLRKTPNGVNSICNSFKLFDYQNK